MNTSFFTIEAPTGDKARSLTWLIREMERDADEVDALAARVRDWDHSPLRALGMIEQANRLCSNGERFYQSDFIGEHTKASLRNEGSIGVGLTNGCSPRGRGDLSYALMHALSMDAQYGPESESARHATHTKASSMRCYAATLRVVAGLLGRVLRGEIGWVG